MKTIEDYSPQPMLSPCLRLCGSNSSCSVLSGPRWNIAVVEPRVGPRVGAELHDDDTHQVHHPAAFNLQQRTYQIKHTLDPRRHQ